MTIKTTYICECCGKEWDIKDDSMQICTVAIAVSFGGVTITNGTFNKVMIGSQHWCRKCVIEKGIQDPTSKEDKAVAPEIPLSFEDKVVELLDMLGYVREQ